MYGMNVFLLLFVILLTESRPVTKKCWSRDEVDVGVYHNFSYQFIFVKEHDAVELQCRECTGSDDSHDVNIFWRRVDIHLNRTESTRALNKQTKSVENGIKVLDNLSLFFKKVQPKHSGLYNCYMNATSREFQSSLTAPFETYSYFIHVSVHKNKLLNGTYTEWNYYEDFVYRSGENKVQALAHANHTSKPSLIVHWSAWGNCLCGKYKYDTRSYRYAYCCVRLFDGLLLPCQSEVLKEIRDDVAKIVENISTFKEYRRCMDDCIPVVTDDEVDFKFQKTYYLRQSSHRQLQCLVSVAGNSTEMLWIRDENILLNKSKNPGEKGSKDVRVAVDSFSTLYLTDVTKDEEGTYSCFDNGLPIVKFLVRVEPHNLILTNECGRKIIILTCIIVVWIVIYVILECVKFGTNAKSDK
ncbi:uncharacterized protein LOC119070282 isoform X2 [Bradysia coprophila]|uniref:uncharacterized protein LOC119070282 isoform X2 n=1 Tax=Bradysia coprophila TaxID=38358 RepID=UPI00187DC1D4|nr:uncharacterized protein LOC119070282 isoform X2 [Bradysia coprophila]